MIKVGDKVKSFGTIISYSGKVVRFEGTSAVVQKDNLEFHVPRNLLKKVF